MLKSYKIFITYYYLFFLDLGRCLFRLFQVRVLVKIVEVTNCKSTNQM